MLFYYWHAAPARLQVDDTNAQTLTEYEGVTMFQPKVATCPPWWLLIWVLGWGMAIRIFAAISPNETFKGKQWCKLPMPGASFWNFLLGKGHAPYEELVYIYWIISRAPRQCRGHGGRGAIAFVAPVNGPDQGDCYLYACIRYGWNAMPRCLIIDGAESAWKGVHDWQ